MSSRIIKEHCAIHGKPIYQKLLMIVSYLMVVFNYSRFFYCLCDCLKTFWPNQELSNQDMKYPVNYQSIELFGYLMYCTDLSGLVSTKEVLILPPGLKKPVHPNWKGLLCSFLDKNLEVKSGASCCCFLKCKIGVEKLFKN